MTAPLLDTTKDDWLESDPGTIRDQVGMRNILAISGGRMIRSATGGLILPVSSGYKVTIDLAPGDTYTVRRIHVRAGVTRLHGEMTGVYCEQLSEIAYQASCFRNGPFGAVQTGTCTYCQDELPLSELEPFNPAGNLAHRDPRKCSAFEPESD